MTEALRARLEEALAASGVPGTVFVGPLDDADASGAALILFLYRIVPNASLRNREHRVPSDDPPPRGRRLQNALPLDLYYLVTVGTTPGASEETLLQALGLRDAGAATSSPTDRRRRSVTRRCVSRSSRSRRKRRAASGRCSRPRTTAPRSPISRRRCGSIRRSRSRRPRASCEDSCAPGTKSSGGGTMLAASSHLPLEAAYMREALFAVELLDAVTLERVSRGVEVIADGLRRQADRQCQRLLRLARGGRRAAAGCHRSTRDAAFQREHQRRTAGTAATAARRVELAPRFDYPFAPGVTGLRGTLIESCPGHARRRSPAPKSGCNGSTTTAALASTRRPIRTAKPVATSLRCCGFAPTEVPKLERRQERDRPPARRAATA